MNDFIKGITLPKHAFLGLGVFLIVVVIVILSKKIYENEKTDPAMIKKGSSFIKQSTNAIEISQSSSNPIIALQQANYALAYFNAARELAEDRELKECTKVSLNELKDNIERQEKMTKDMIQRQQLPPKLHTIPNVPQFQQMQVRPPIPQGQVEAFQRF